MSLPNVINLPQGVTLVRERNGKPHNCGMQVRNGIFKRQNGVFRRKCRRALALLGKLGVGGGDDADGGSVARCPRPAGKL